MKLPSAYFFLVLLTAIFFASLLAEPCFLIADPADNSLESEQAGASHLLPTHDSAVETLKKNEHNQIYPGGSDTMCVDLLPRALFWQDAANAAEELSIEEASARADAFVPWSMGLSWRGTGAVWMRLSLAGMERLPEQVWLCLGTQTPGNDALWILRQGHDWSSAGKGRLSSWLVDTRGIREIMVRMEGTPGLWFAPRLCAADKIACLPEWACKLGTMSALGILALLCLLLSLSGRSDSHLWIALLAGSAVVNLWFCVPSLGAKMSFPAVCCVFSGGMALMLLPHVGRAVMATGQYAPKTDIFYMLLAILGALLALLPMVPSFAWLDRLFVLWPIMAALCFLPAFLLIFSGVRGSLHFSAGCLFMSGGCAAALYGMQAGIGGEWPFVAAQGGVLAGLLVMAASFPRQASIKTEPGELLPLAQPEQDGYGPQEDAAARVREGVDAMLTASCRLDQALSRAGIGEEKADIVIHADRMAAAARGIAEHVRALPPDVSLPEPDEEIFDLRDVMQKAFAHVHGDAKAKGLGLAWYVSPYLGRRYRGDAASLNALLPMFMADAVRASDSGTVSLRVSRLESSTNPGHLQFVISDSGKNGPPRGRNSLLISRLWGLAFEHAGNMSMQSGPKGTSITFSMEFEALAEEKDNARAASFVRDADGSERCIILASADGLLRRIWAHYLDGIGYSVKEAASADAAVSLYGEEHAALVIIHGGLGEDAIAHAIAAIRHKEGEMALPAVPFLLLSSEKAQAERLADAGCNQWLLLPAVRRDIRALSRWLASSDGVSRRPALLGGRQSMAEESLDKSSPDDLHQGMTLTDQDSICQSTGLAIADDDAAASQAPQGSVSGVSALMLYSVKEADAEKTLPPDMHADEQQGADDAAGAAGDDLLMLGGEQSRDKGGWLSSVFKKDEQADSSLEILPVPDLAAQDDEIVDLLQENAVAAARTDCPVVDLEKEDMMVQERGTDAGDVVDLTEILPPKSDAGAPAGEEATDVQASCERFCGTEQEESTGGMDDPSCQILGGIAAMEQALASQDSPAMLSAAENMISIAGAYGMRYLEDMALCVRDACTAGDLSGTSLVVKDMRAELERYMRQ